MRRVSSLVLMASLAAAVAEAQQPPSGAYDDGCVVTVPNRADRFFGTDRLSVALQYPDTTVVFRPGGPGTILPDGSLSMKFGWLRNLRGALAIDGRRLDAPAEPLRASIPTGYGDMGFQATALIFPTPGCWEVTGRIADETVTFVVRVVKR